MYGGGSLKKGFGKIGTTGRMSLKDEPNEAAQTTNPFI